MTDSQSNTEVRWWKFGHVWLVIAGPALVVVASFITFYVAMTNVDPLLDKDNYQQVNRLNQSSTENSGNMAPAIQGRNHAATGVPPTKTAP
jgi:hypothetical protein